MEIDVEFKLYAVVKKDESGKWMAEVPLYDIRASRFDCPENAVECVQTLTEGNLVGAYERGVLFTELADKGFAIGRSTMPMAVSDLLQKDEPHTHVVNFTAHLKLMRKSIS